MNITGSQLIGNQHSAKGEETLSAVNPKNGETLPVLFHEATFYEIDKAVKLAEKAFPVYAKKSPGEKAAFLDRIADEILDLGDELIERCMAESALPEGRLKGERGRTVNQLKLFAKVVREGSWVDARIDTAIPDRQPFPKADIRQMLTPLGPVGIFGASNFPLAFSVAGGDTASALAAGCTVVVKGHPAHPGTSEMIGSAILKAANATGMPEGVFSLIQGGSHATGGALVQHPLVKAIGFTGSYRGGKALFDLANRREVPIPIFAEMGSTNPVFILPEAMKQNGSTIAEGLAGSVTLGVGQFCTNPGLVFAPQSESFQQDLADSIQPKIPGTMLTPGIKFAYEKGTERLAKNQHITSLATSEETNSANGVRAKVFHTSFTAFSKNPQWAEEVFGPSTLLVDIPEKEAILQAARSLEGHLTATVHGTEADLKEYQELIHILERKVGRIVFNGYPTGVEVCHSMVHGGPFPATTAPQTTSVGTNAIKRFARPVCYQGTPQFLLPDALKDGNPQGIWRLVDGEFKK